MRFHLIDRIDAWESRQRVVARKLTSHAEEYWRDDGTGPRMPRPLVLEALCQAGTWLVMCSTDLRLRAALLSIDEVTFHRWVAPGEVLTLDGVVESMNDETAVLSGTASVDGELVMRAEAIMCALIPAEDLEDPQATGRMRDHLTRMEASR